MTDSSSLTMSAITLWEPIISVAEYISNAVNTVYEVLLEKDV